jgi:hypothetical protein
VIGILSMARRLWIHGGNRGPENPARKVGHASSRGRVLERAHRKIAGQIGLMPSAAAIAPASVG